MKLPISIRERKPFQNALLISAARYDGLPEGTHTGGAYVYEDKVYKPLDARPFMNAKYHLPTLEAEMLEQLSDLHSFPKNWTVETHNERRWLVRKKAFVPG